MQRNGNNREIESVYNLTGDEYEQWAGKMDSLDINSPQHKQLADIAAAVEEKRSVDKEKVEAIYNAVRNTKTPESIKNAVDSAFTNVKNEGYYPDAPSYFTKVLAELQRNTTPEVSVWYKKFGITG